MKFFLCREVHNVVRSDKTTFCVFSYTIASIVKAVSRTQPYLVLISSYLKSRLSVGAQSLRPDVVPDANLHSYDKLYNASDPS